MSQRLVIEISDDVYDAIQQKAEETRRSPADVVATSLEQHFTRHSRSVRNVLVHAGLADAHSKPLTDAHPLSDEQRKALARQVAGGRPLSEYIREERGRTYSGSDPTAIVGLSCPLQQ